MSKLQELALMLGLSLATITAQLGSTPMEAQRIADEVLSSMYDVQVMKEKIEDAKRRSSHTINIQGYTVKF